MFSISSRKGYQCTKFLVHTSHLLTLLCRICHLRNVHSVIFIQTRGTEWLVFYNRYELSRAFFIYRSQWNFAFLTSYYMIPSSISRLTSSFNCSFPSRKRRERKARKGCPWLALTSICHECDCVIPIGSVILNLF